MKLADKIKAHPAVARFFEYRQNRLWQFTSSALDGRCRWYQQKDYWCYLKDGWINPYLGCSLIHEPTLTEVWAQLRKCKEVAK